MAQLLSLRVPTPPPTQHHRTQPSLLTYPTTTPSPTTQNNFTFLQHKLKSNGRFSCLFSDNSRRQEEARKALEGALGGKKIEYEKWDKEMKRREEAGGGGNSGGGGWFNWGRWFGGSDDGRFWQEAQQASLAVLGIIVIYLIVAKGDVILAVIFNPLLFTLRGARNGFTFITSQIMRRVYPASQDNFGTISQEEVSPHVSAKESVARKWGSG